VLNQISYNEQNYNDDVANVVTFIDVVVDNDSVNVDDNDNFLKDVLSVYCSDWFR